MSSTLLRLILRSVTAGFFLLAAVLLYVQYRIPAGWPSVYGRVEEATVVRDDASGGSGPGERFVPAVVYTYEVAGTRYEAHRVTPFRWVYWSRDRAGSFLDNAGIYRGARIPVYFDPQEPADAVLVRSLPWGKWEVQLMFLVLVVLPLGVVGYSFLDLLRGGVSRRDDTSRGRFW